MPPKHESASRDGIPKDLDLQPILPMPPKDELARIEYFGV
jgi:hypothetical protein